LGFKVVWERNKHVFQLLFDFAPKAKYYFSDALDAYSRLLPHGGIYDVSDGKRETYSVEGDNSELRYYLARLARSSRCFSKCPYGLVCALCLFIYAFNRRQLYKQLYPFYPAQVINFVNL
jgi:IS1 family transposase